MTPPTFLFQPLVIFMTSSSTSRRCNNHHGLIRKYGLNLCRRCFREHASDIGFLKVSLYVNMVMIHNAELCVVSCARLCSLQAKEEGLVKSLSRGAQRFSNEEPSGHSASDVSTLLVCMGLHPQITHRHCSKLSVVPISI